MTLCLPRDAITVPVSRHVCHSALAEVGATEDVISDIEIALAEACTNVLDHAGPGDEYEITAEVDPEVCVIRVVDTGRGFDAAALRDDAGRATDERGRGVTLMKALVDQVSFVSKDEVGTLVHLEKRLTFHDGAPMQRLAASTATS